MHFVYAGLYYHYKREDKLRTIILNRMKKHKIKSVMVTSIQLYRRNLITKEKMESYCMGEERTKNSVNDDLESLLENILLGKELDEVVVTYFLPKLTKEELEWAERRDTSYFQTFRALIPDVGETEMMLSESESKYVYGISSRRTFVIENSSQISSETSSETSSENSSKNLLENLNENSSEKQSCLKNCNCSLQ